MNGFSQFVRFGVVGAVGFVIDTATVYTLRPLAGLYAAALIAYFAAATGTWFLNRTWTFRGLGHGSLLRQWIAFVAANSAGFLLNRGTFLALALTVPVVTRNPVIAVAAGSLAGMFVNFGLSRRLVFR